MVVITGAGYFQGHRDRVRAVEPEQPAQTDRVRVEASEAGTPLTMANLMLHAFHSRSVAVLSSQGSSTISPTNPFDLDARLQNQDNESLAGEEPLSPEGIIEEDSRIAEAFDEFSLPDIPEHEGRECEERPLVQVMEEYVQTKEEILRGQGLLIQQRDAIVQAKLAETTDSSQTIARFVEGRLRKIEKEKQELEEEKEWLEKLRRGVEKTRKRLEKMNRVAERAQQVPAKVESKAHCGCCSIS